MSSPSIPSQPALAPAAMSPLKEVWTIAWPTVLSMTSYTVMQFTDQLMVGQVGPLQLAAQSNGGMWSFTLLAFVLGILTVVNTYVSQNLGAGTPRNAPKYAWAAIWLGIFVWLTLMIPYGLGMRWIYGEMLPHFFPHVLEGHTHELLSLETNYASILVLGSIFPLIGRGVNQFFFGMHRPRIVTLAAITANIVNVIGAYILIYGSNGLPRLGLGGIPGVTPMGVKGAAIATVIGSAVEMLIPLMIFLGAKLNAELNTRAAWKPQFSVVRDLLRIGWPAAIQWGNELACWSIFTTVLVGSFGVNHMSASSIAFGYMRLSFMPAIGFSVATTSLVGKYIGAKQPDVAVARARLTLLLAMAYMTACGIVFICFRTSLIKVFIDPQQAANADEVIRIGGSIMIAMAVCQAFDAIGMIYSGALRGAGDTVWPGFVTVIYSWAFIVGGGWSIAHFWPGLQSLGPWIAAVVYISLFGLTMGWRFSTGRWRSIKLLHNPAHEAAGLVPVMPGPPEIDASGAVEDLAQSMAAANEPGTGRIASRE